MAVDSTAAVQKATRRASRISARECGVRTDISSRTEATPAVELYLYEELGPPCVCGAGCGANDVAPPAGPY